MNTKATFKNLYRIIFAVIAWYALGGHFFQIVVHRSPEWSALGATINYFSYFTIQSNWLVALWWTLAIFGGNSPRQSFFLSPRLKGALTVYITVTFAVYALLLADTWEPTGFDWLFANITHYITPLAFILDWLLFETRGVYQSLWALDWLVYPVAYFIYALVYGAVIGHALYPFFDYAALGWGGMALQVSFLLVFFAFLELLYIAANRLLGRWLPNAVEA
ncbi:MAG: Pr6Pr family membrane protein [Anaerolineales bacterium]|nr:Pr6Pr family membrane protein [Anaerolineales bacterium]